MVNINSEIKNITETTLKHTHMKRLTTTLFVILAIALQVMGQSPRKFSYQAVVRNADGTIIANQEVDIKVSLLVSEDEGSALYTEVHTVTTTPQGVVNLVVGNGTEATGSLDDIPWADGNIDIQIDIKMDEATEFVTMGTTRILAVPYALYAATGTPGPQGPQGEPGISLLWLGSLDAAPTEPSLNQAYYNTVDKKSYVYNGTEWTTLAQDGTDGEPGADGVGILWKGSLDAAPVEPVLNWAYYNTVDKKSYIFDGTEWTILTQDGEQGPVGPLVEGTAGQMLMHDGTSWMATGKVKLTDETFEVRADADHDPEQPIFAVYNSDSKMTFAVYENGTRVYVEDSGAKAGSKGGFAVGGLTQGKEEINYFILEPDSVRFNIVEVPSKAGSKGGFAVGGLTQGKSATNDYMNINFDEARFTIRDDAKSGSKGGFAVGGLTQNKFGESDYFMVNTDSTFIQNTLSAMGDMVVSGSMTTGGIVGTLAVKDVEGNEYATVRIGNQIWMKENLRTTKYADGTPIELQNSLIYGVTDDADTLSIFGRLYTEAAVYSPTGGGVCPTGWHVPNFLDWMELLTFVGGADWASNAEVTGQKLMEKGTVGATTGHWMEDNLANNISGFSGRPGGTAYFSGSWFSSGVGYEAYWWSIGQTLAEYYILDGAGISSGEAPAGQAFSVRCIKDY